MPGYPADPANYICVEFDNLVANGAMCLAQLVTDIKALPEIKTVQDPPGHKVYDPSTGILIQALLKIIRQGSTYSKQQARDAAAQVVRAKPGAAICGEVCPNELGISDLDATNGISFSGDQYLGTNFAMANSPDSVGIPLNHSFDKGGFQVYAGRPYAFYFRELGRRRKRRWLNNDNTSTTPVVRHDDYTDGGIWLPGQVFSEEMMFVFAVDCGILPDYTDLTNWLTVFEMAPGTVITLTAAGGATFPVTINDGIRLKLRFPQGPRLPGLDDWSTFIGIADTGERKFAFGLWATDEGDAYFANAGDHGGGIAGAYSARGWGIQQTSQGIFGAADFRLESVNGGRTYALYDYDATRDARYPTAATVGPHYYAVVNAEGKYELDVCGQTPV